MTGDSILPPDELEAVVRTVVERLRAEPGDGASATTERASDARAQDPGPDLDTLVQQTHEAFRALQELSLERRAALIEAMRAAVRVEAADLAVDAVRETRLGRADDKVQKNLLVGEKTPGIEILEPYATTGDHGLTLQELAPWGVIGAVAPSTNPTETIICNAIGMVAAGNGVVFCPHPLAERVSKRIIDALDRAIVTAGGPPHLICGVPSPTIEKAQALMRHPGLRLIVVTGGPGVVREAMRSGKRVIGAGPGNPPALVDETAELPQAARDLVAGASLDNNIVCTDEKEVVVVRSVADRLKSEMEGAGALEIHGPQIEALADLVLEERSGREGRVRKEWVGQDAVRYLDAIGIRPRQEPRLILAEVDAEHPFLWTELLMPILPLVRVRDFETAMELAVAAEKGNRHTATMHSQHVGRLSRMARRLDCSIFVKNGPAYAGLGLGGEGYTSFTIAGPTGEGLTTARNFARLRRCTLVDAFRIV